MNKKKNYKVGFFAFCGCLIIFGLSLFINILVFQNSIKNNGEKKDLDSVHTAVLGLANELDRNLLSLEKMFLSTDNLFYSTSSGVSLSDYDGIAFFYEGKQLVQNNNEVELSFLDNRESFICISNAIVYYGIPLQSPLFLSNSLCTDLIVVYISVYKTLERIENNYTNTFGIINSMDEVVYSNTTIKKDSIIKLGSRVYKKTNQALYYTQAGNFLVCAQQITGTSYYYIEFVPRDENLRFYGYPSIKFISIAVFNMSILAIILVLLRQYRFYHKQKEQLSSTRRYICEVSHELRNPLNGILGLQGMMKESIDDKEQVLNYIKQLEGSTSYMKKLVNDITDISKGETKRIVFNEQSVDLEFLVKSTAKMLETQLDAKNIQLSIQTSLQYSQVYVDSTRLMQVIINLVSNAIKFSAENGLIVLQVSQNLLNSKETKLVVSDNGCGMSSEFLKKIWLPFSQENRIFYQESSGIGTTITKMIVEQMGGNITVWSELGKGSTFTVTLPLKPAETLKSKSLENVRVLIAEDNEIQREMLQRILTKEKMEVTVASDGVQVIEKFVQSSNYDVIILDNRMPKLTGIEVSYKLKELMKQKNVSIPIILASGEEESVEGLFSYIKKPYSIEEILNLIKLAIK